MIIETERLILRRFDQDDAEFILRLLNTPDFLRFIGDRGVRNIEDARRYIENGPLRSYSDNGYGLLVVELSHNRTPIGMCGLMRRAWLEAPDIAYAFLPEAAGCGYASEAAAAVLAHARDELDIERVVAIVKPNHAASIRVLEKLGFAAEGSVKDPATGETLGLHRRAARS